MIERFERLTDEQKKSVQAAAGFVLSLYESKALYKAIMVVVRCLDNLGRVSVTVRALKSGYHPVRQASE